jgi:hypothetical protein
VVFAEGGDGLAAKGLVGKELLDRGGSVAHGDGFVWGKALAGRVGLQYVVGRTVAVVVDRKECWISFKSGGLDKIHMLNKKVEPSRSVVLNLATAASTCLCGGTF